MRVCVIVDNPMTYDRRVLRQVRTLRRLGHDVTVVALDDPDGRELPDLAGAAFSGVPSFGQMGIADHIRGGRSTGERRATSSPIAGLRGAAATAFLRSSSYLGHQRYLRRSLFLGRRAIPTRPDVCHANNLGSLPAALACKAAFGSAVVYDAHELESDRANFTKLARLRARLVEKVCIRHADRVVAACDGYATYIAGRYRIPPPTVVRNVAEPHEYRDALPIRTGNGRPPTILYIGGIRRSRGLELLIDALPMVADVRVLMVGPDVRLTEPLLRRAVERGVRDRVEIRPAVPPDELGSVLELADLGYCGFQNVALSYYYGLPNKVFQYLAYGLPVVGSDLPEIRSLLWGSGAGALFEPGSHESLAKAIATVLRGDREMFHARALELARANSWDHEEQRLVRLYDDLATDRARRNRAWLLGSRGPNEMHAPYPS